jgi:hypothetical protein
MPLLDDSLVEDLGPSLSKAEFPFGGDLLQLPGKKGAFLLVSAPTLSYVDLLQGT